MTETSALLTQVLSRCTEHRPLAEGGQKRVIAAKHTDYGNVVVKYGSYPTASSLMRITREVQLLNTIESQYYPRQHEFVVDALKSEFVVIEELLDAQELSAVSGKLSSDEAILKFLQELVGALGLLWDRNVVHRDIKPANILVTESLQPRVIDLGIARFLDNTSLTQSYAARGPNTPIYAAPEQLLNHKDAINHRTDFFLLGIMTLQLMHGFHPYDPIYVGSEKPLVDNILAGRFVPAADDREPRLVAFTTNVLQTKPFKRPRTVALLREQLGMGEA